eukprot:SAG11_NODE_4249_length_1986_cov_2.119237_1_plen_161_part_10
MYQKIRTVAAIELPLDGVLAHGTFDEWVSLYEGAARYSPEAGRIHIKMVFNNADPVLLDFKSSHVKRLWDEVDTGAGALDTGQLQILIEGLLCASGSIRLTTDEIDHQLPQMGPLLGGRRVTFDGFEKWWRELSVEVAVLQRRMMGAQDRAEQVTVHPRTP